MPAIYRIYINRLQIQFPCLQSKQRGRAQSGARKNGLRFDGDGLQLAGDVSDQRPRVQRDVGIVGDFVEDGDAGGGPTAGVSWLLSRMFFTLSAFLRMLRGTVSSSLMRDSTSTHCLITASAFDILSLPFSSGNSDHTVPAGAIPILQFQRKNFRSSFSSMNICTSGI